MLDRASFSADPELVELITKRFVPVALDVWYEERRDDAAGALYHRIVNQREGMQEGRTTQGFYIATAQGELLQGWNNRNPDKLKRLLRESLDKRKSTPVVDSSATVDPHFARELPAGGVVVDVYSKVIEADYTEPADSFAEAFRRSLGRDHLWILPDEVAALVRGELPESLARRIARFHLIDNTRGEPPMWERSELRSVEWTAATSAIEGRVQLESAEGQRGYSARLFGEVEIKDRKLVRFDLVARGVYHGAGTYTSNAMPDGPFTFAVAFHLASADDLFASVPPQGARDLHDYLDP